METGRIGTTDPIPESRLITLRMVLAGMRKQRRSILIFSWFGILAGIIAALTVNSIYTSDATIALKQSEGESGAAGFFSGFGGFGAAASQLVGSGGSLDKVQIYLHSRELAEKVVLRSGLDKRILASRWDAKKNRWKGEMPPQTSKIADHLRSKLLRTQINNQKQIMTIIIESADSGITRPLVESYLIELSEKLKSNVKKDADSNRTYLERNLSATSDPILREKIVNIMANEIERSMLLRNTVIDIIEKPYNPESPSRPNKKLLIVTALVIGLALGMGWSAVRTIWEEV